MQFETSINWLNDFHWGPFESMRPPKDADMDRRLFVRICAWGVSLIVVGVLPVLSLLYDSSFFVPDSHASVLVNIGRVVWETVREFWWLLAAAVVFFPLMWWPCTVCWNRRAARLRRQAADGPSAEVLTGVWPPPPIRE